MVDKLLRAAAVRAGRHANIQATSTVSRPRLDGRQHGGTLKWTGIARSIET